MTRKRNGTIGGCLPQIWLLDSEKVGSYLPDGAGSVSIVHADDPVRLEFSPRTLACEEAPAEDDTQGGSVEIRIEGSMPRSMAAASALLGRLSRRKWIALVGFAAGGTKAYGSPDYPLSFRYTVRVSEDHSFNGYEVVLSGFGLQEAPFLASFSCM